jgi:NarL family two-component system response regulator LiaR
MTDVPIRVFIVDDQTLVRKGIGALLREIGGFEIVGEAADGYQAFSMAQALNPDVILIDPVLPGISGIEAIHRLIATWPHARILVLTSFTSEDKVFATIRADATRPRLPAILNKRDKVFATIRAGAMGCLLKDADPLDLARAIRALHYGEPYLAPAIARRILYEMSHPMHVAHNSGPTGMEHLTERESAVLQLLAKGLGNQAIASRLQVSEATVRSHVSNILGKLHLANRVQATLYALREGIATLENGLPR